MVALLLHPLRCSLLAWVPDLETDYINHYDTAPRINVVILPEFISQGVLCLLYALSGQWFILLMSIPYLCYNIRSYMRNRYLIDVTEIYNNIGREKTRRLFKLYYLISLMLLSIGWVIYTHADHPFD
ncbi:protein cornichon homolog 4-like isoform X2 [Punica granatum]|uniref:Protein cornichon homolog 4-like isoform X2 n=1 Tax=Punica granatum TaxID=22663 RepID=A0A218WJB1_PUNGR|nr:protein cornichon homolog 4-like isoform X2 [Punica granatum]OWM72924.1 hypothetical protein CDL15_Pgr016556 [Punica granatum]